MEATSTPFEITSSDIVAYWLKLLPELENERQLKDLFDLMGDLNMEEAIQRLRGADIGEPITASEERVLQLPSLWMENHRALIENTIPFFNFMCPFVSMEIDSFFARVAELDIVEDVDAFVEESIKQLLDQLFQLSYRVLIVEIHSASSTGKLLGETSEDRLTYYTTVMLQDKAYLSSIYNEYEVLTRLMKESTVQYFEYMLEILTRTQSEISNLEHKFNRGDSIGKIVRIETGVGDGHNGGRTVSMLLFPSGKKIVYKPRSLELEEGFNQMLSWLEERCNNKLLGYRTCAVHTKEDYGWMEFIAYKSCSDSDELKRFYKRTGQLLCLLYVTRSVDFHYENLIAHGEFPMLIDMESIFHAELKYEEKEKNSGYVTARRMINQSVNAISLLPKVLSNKDPLQETMFDLSGLSMDEEQLVPIKSLFIEDLNTDRIKVVKKDSILQPKSNNPMMNGKRVKSEDYVSEIIAGFEGLYSWIMNHKALVCRMLADIFRPMRSRAILKATTFYSKLLSIAQHPDFLRDEVSRKLILHRVGINAPREQQWVIRSEFEDLSHNDIPYFTVSIQDTKLMNGRKETCDDLITQSPLAAALERIESLSDKDLRRQLDFIEMSYLNRRSNCSDITNLSFSPRLQKLTPEKWLRTAVDIGDYIMEVSLNGVNNSGNQDRFWVSTTIQGFEEKIWKPDVLGFDLYSGNPGVALFLGYLGKLTGRGDFLKAAFEAMEMPRQIIATLKKDILYPVGAFSGLSGVFYTLGKLWSLEPREETADYIAAYVSTILVEIEKDSVYDVVSGSFGALAVSFSLLGSSDNRIRAAGTRLLERTSSKLLRSYESDQEMVYWPAYGNKSYAGFSHGSAGAAAYLYRLYQFTKDNRILPVLEGAMKMERSLYSSDHKNWHTTDTSHEVGNGWCHGAPGILLGKTILKEHGYTDSLIDKEIHTAMNTAIRMGIGNNPTYCHGDLGTLSILNYAARVSKNEALRNQAIQTYQELYDRVLSKEWNSRRMKSGWTLSLMIGITGFGYSMLSNYEPGCVPEFLWLE